jgi:Mg2+-importing ATPase
MSSLFKPSQLLDQLPNGSTSKGKAGAPVGSHEPFYREVAQADADRVYRLLRSDKQGLSNQEAARRLLRTGPNEVAHEKRAGWLAQLWDNAKTPFNVLLVGLSAVNFYTDNPIGGYVVGGMVVLSVLLTFLQEFRSNRAAESLLAMVTTTVTVLRKEEMEFALGERRELIVRADRREVPLRDLVPGDLLQLAAGDMIPADLRVLQAKDLFIAQAALTGESFPVEKSAAPVKGDGSVLEQADLCFMGSNVLSGTALAMVVKTGQDTYFGTLAKGLLGARALTSFEQGVNKYTQLMFKFMAVMVPLVFLINWWFKDDLLEAAMFAVAVAVGLTPEMLPMIVTVNLAKGALAMSRKKVIVKRLNSIQNFGAMDVLCTDKTGTLTADKVVLLRYVDPNGFKSPRVLQLGYLNSFHQTGLRNLLDVAVLDQKKVAAELKAETDWRKVDEIPFDFQRRRMSVVVAKQGGLDLLICKGALEEVFHCCDRVEVDGEVVHLDEELQQRYRNVARELNDDGLRVIAVGYRELPAGHAPCSVADESAMVLTGYLAFLDPPKESAEEAIRLLKSHGVSVKVLTGDNDAVTRHICQEVGIPCERIILGAEMEGMGDDALDAVVEQVAVYSKLSPSQKERVIRSLHRRGHVVGFMGDGINDAPALKAADVGISVDNAVDIAKESADIILLEKSLLVLEQGVQEGRKVFGNIIKYIKMGASSSFGNMFSVLGASCLLPFLPMQSTQILTQNLLYDFSQTTIPFDHMDPEYLAKPRRWEIGNIGRFMLCMGPISSIFDYCTFGLMWFMLGCKAWKAVPAGQPDHWQALFQSGWFVEGLLSQTLIVHMIRTAKIPFIQSRASWPLLASTAVIMAAGIYIPMGPLGRYLGFEPLPWVFFPWLVAMLLGYVLLTYFVKAWFIRHWGFD